MEYRIHPQVESEKRCSSLDSSFGFCDELGMTVWVCQESSASSQKTLDEAWLG
jgi:hypothetical protein